MHLVLYYTVKCRGLYVIVDMDCNGAQYYFNAVKEGDSVTFATDDMYERYNWVQALCRATGQSHKPTPPVITTTANGGNTPNLPNLPKGQGGGSIGQAGSSLCLLVALTLSTLQLEDNS